MCFISKPARSRARTRTLFSIEINKLIYQRYYCKFRLFEVLYGFVAVVKAYLIYTVELTFVVIYYDITRVS